MSSENFRQTVLVSFFWILHFVAMWGIFVGLGKHKLALPLRNVFIALAAMLHIVLGLAFVSIELGLSFGGAAIALGSADVLAFMGWGLSDPGSASNRR